MKQKLNILGECLLVFLLMGFGAAKQGGSPGVQWAGNGEFRLLVKVEPENLDNRISDEMPAEIVIDLSGQLSEMGVVGTADITSLQIIRFDPMTGQPIPYDSYAYAHSPYDRPFRWYDSAIPYDFPEFSGVISSTKGRIIRKKGIRLGYMYNAIGDWKKGHLAWIHSQQKNEPSYYGIYFDILPLGKLPAQVPPRGWIGDGLPRHDIRGDSTTAADHTNIALDDWNADGLFDIIFGEQYGQLSVLINTGRSGEPEFGYSKLLFDADGLPIDVGMHAAPLVVDWDNDGVKDILVGTYRNRIVFFKNEGTNQHRKLAYQGFLRDENGQVLELPTKPVAAQSEAIFKHDYYPVLETVDWNGDGKQDLIAGGYITGRVYYFENIAENKNALPVLALKGPLEADGKAINVGDWCAAPCIADFNNDGKPDLITGGLPMTDSRRDRLSYLGYYENTGSSSKPVLSQKKFPTSNDSLRLGLSRPRAVDWNQDGLWDLIVSARDKIYMIENIGNSREPNFEYTGKALPSIWANARLPVGHQFIDWNKDGLPDAVSNYKVRLNSGRGNPYFFDKTVNILPPGVNIAHPSGIGDDWFWPYLYDFNQDGKIDVLFGDWYGHIWFHQNLSTFSGQKFDIEGYRLQMVNGEYIKVGPMGADTDKDFVALQGARTVFCAADFDADGLDDLVAGDTYGILRYFRNTGTKDKPEFALPYEIDNLGSRLLVTTTDWNSDGHMDIIAGTSSGKVRVFLNNDKKGSDIFDEGFDPGLPPAKQPRVVMVDMNDDGDEDLFVPGTQGSLLIERSFLHHGYAQGQLLGTDKKDFHENEAPSKTDEKLDTLILKKVQGNGQGGAVLDLGKKGSFDDKWVTCPSVLYDGKQYRMYYSSFYDSKLGVGGIGLATSDDGIHWKRANDGRPVLTTGPQGEFDDGQVMGPEVLFDGKIYRMWYTGMNKVWHESGFGFYRIGLATSTDGIHWKRENGGKPVLDIGPAGSYDEVQSATPSILKENSGYRMWYAAWSPDKKRSHKICAASSTDGIHWQRENDGKSITGLAHEFAYGPAVCRYKNEYLLFYMPLLAEPAIFAAKSTDGIHWKPVHGKDPIVDKGQKSDFDVSRSGHPYITVMDDKLRCWYTGYRVSNGLELKIGLAVEED